ncbi:rnhA operon protein [Natrinema hispanicum]|uniref:RnhA operon protein n=1 Tax=Natrinema hispanicum TaxID=392421 RepID=A0A1G6LW70_9EURY|nr:rnhA operon protein [Natrinema hispanicum]SDC46956.1 hypothetical protein SAMN05192552_1004102 [Natrinema hispanicum]SET19707.1 hypothetical protein SAMN04488694_104200 [Natrinema hispanicum]
MTDPNAIDGDEDGDEAASDETDLPRDVADEVERLTRLKRTTVDDNEATAYEQRRDDLLDEHDFTSRIRDDDGDDVLVLHPEEWHEDGVIRTDRIEDIDRAVEIPLEGTGDPDEWDDVDAHNRDLVATVRDTHGDVHANNAAILADFAGNHYAKPIESLTGDDLAEFCTDYFVRNAWPSDDQQEVIAESIELIFETADERVPNYQF